jgi:Cd(II)/Pb(II)-responsive transcriptional regulator
MQIGELARLTGCDVETIRFYEREGLLYKPARDPNGYRRYDDAHLTQLGFIRHCRSLDIALSDIRTLLAFNADPSLACGEINDLIDRQIAGVHARIESLLNLEGQLKALRSACGRDVSTAECGIIEDLRHAPTDAHCHCHVATREAGTSS